jgi:hypothetical protein
MIPAIQILLLRIRRGYIALRRVRINPMEMGNSSRIRMPVGTIMQIRRLMMMDVAAV